MQMLVLLSALALVPVPKEVETTGGTRSLSSAEIVRAVAAFEQDAAIPKEGYRLVVDERGVRVAAADAAGKKSRLYSGVCDAKGGAGAYAFRTALNDPAGTWRVVATDYVTGKTASVSFLLGE